MNKKEILEILKIIFKSIKNQNPIWRLEGSANLYLQWVNVNVRDLDITTTKESLDIFRNILNQYIVRDFFNEKINADSIVCDINWFEVELNYYYDEFLNMFDKIQKIEIENMQIPILPLKDAKKFYELIDRKEKVELIEKYLKN